MKLWLRSASLLAILVLLMLHVTMVCFPTAVFLHDTRTETGTMSSVRHKTLVTKEQVQKLSRSSKDNHHVGATNFHLDPEAFVSTLAGCFHDANCRIYYYHLAKSGGTDLESKMFAYFSKRIDPCCNQRLMRRFRNDTDMHCQANFSSYEVTAPMFIDEIVPTCMNITGGRAVILATFREPIQRTVSSIHQKCNKKFYARSVKLKRACTRCSYLQDKDFWNEFIEFSNHEYEMVKDVVTAKIPKTTVLTIDMTDLSILYGKLHSISNHSAFLNKERVNSEETQRCDFGFTSEMMRRVRPSFEIYRNLTLGSLY